MPGRLDIIVEHEGCRRYLRAWTMPDGSPACTMAVFEREGEGWRPVTEFQFDGGARKQRAYWNRMTSEGKVVWKKR